MAVKSWQLGYDATTGNFVELGGDLGIEASELDDARRVAFENQITAILEQKGLLADQAKNMMADAYAQGTTLDALKWASQQTGKAEDRGDVWGTGGGKAYLTSDAVKNAQGQVGDRISVWKDNAALINNLYTEGFGREADTAGLEYWTKKLSDGDMTYQEIAASFGASEEATIRTDYHETFGRDVDDAGLQYWLQKDNVYSKDALTGSLEQDIRNEYADKLGQFSTAEERKANMDAGGFWTDAQEGGYANLDWRSYDGTGQTGIQTDFGNLRYDFGTDKTSPFGTGDDLHFGATGTFDDGTDKTGVERFRASIANETDADKAYQATSSFSGNTISSIDDVRNILQRREDLMNISSTYDKDDAEGGSGIGRIFTLAEMEPYMEESADLQGLAENLGAEKWSLLTKELEKTFKTFDEADPTGKVIYDPGHNPNVRDTNRNTLSHDYQVPVPPDYQSPDLANVNRQNVDYMPKLDGTVPNRPLRNLDSSYTQAPQQAVRNQGTFVAGSAQGVRRKQSSAARSGRSAMGTKQLARNNMQIKSLNI